MSSGVYFESLPNCPNYRIVSRTNQKEILEYSETSEDAVEIAVKVDGVVQCYVWGWGWVWWQESMKERTAL